MNYYRLKCKIGVYGRIVKMWAIRHWVKGDKFYFIAVDKFGNTGRTVYNYIIKESDIISIDQAKLNDRGFLKVVK